jgi:hypothetical protein
MTEATALKPSRTEASACEKAAEAVARRGMFEGERS